MKLLIVDDDPLVCRSLKTILEADPDLRIAGIGYDGNEAIELYRLLLPDILLMDIRMPRMSGLEAAESILKAHPEAKILFLTTFSDTEYIVKTLRIGAKGYILKQHFESIIPAVRAVSLGQRVFGDEIVTKIPDLLSNSAKKDFQEFHLTQKETVILRWIAEGLSNREISEILFLSEGTVRNYISVMLEKLSLRDRTQLAIFYYKNK
ncbi:MAG: response regulator transcription factor [Syntrophomonadaceae bacterium]|nr:response regulator transcription factor [Syntrophomonadaceae bacterium]